MKVYESERGLLNKTLLLITELRLYKFHDFDSTRSSRGFPDLVIGSGKGLLVRELKNATGELTPDQRQWLLVFKANGIDAGVWRPDDWTSGRIRKELEAIA